MSKKGGDTAPAAPNPVTVANAQTGSNVQTAIANSYLNNTNQIGPDGSVTYRQVGTTRIGAPAGSAGAGSYADQMKGALGGGAGGVTMDGYDIPQWEQTTTLSPEQQKLHDQQMQLGAGMNDLAIGQVGRVTDTLGRPISADGNQPIVGSYNTTQSPTTFGQTAGKIQYNVGPTDFTADRQAVTDATMARFRPQLDMDQNALDAKLANQGIALGSSAYGDAQAGAGRNRNDAYAAAILAGANEQNTLFNQKVTQGNFNNSAQNQDFAQQQSRGMFDMQGTQANNATNEALATFGNTAAGQQLQQQLALRNQPINEVGALMNGGQVTMPQFQAYHAAQVSDTPIGQYMYNSANIDQSNYQAQQQRDMATTNAMIGGLAGIGSAGMFGMMRPKAA